jgi:very-short-patch-repair endonuclease
MPAERAIELDSDAELRARRVGRAVHPDRAVAALAARQHGVVARRQLAALGLGRGAIGRRLAHDRLLLVHRGVYAVGHAQLSLRGRWMAAVLAGPPGTVLSHRDAAALWGIRQVSDGAVEVTTPPGGHHVPGVRRHRCSIQPDEITRRDGIPVTEMTRTIIDLAVVLTCPKVERAINEAEVQGLRSGPPLSELLERYRGRRGIACIRLLVQEAAEPAPTRSELEHRFLALIREHHLPEPAVNAGVVTADGWHEVDLVWRERRLIVELDGHAFHGTRLAFERDRARDRALQVAGWRVLRITWRQLLGQPAAIAADLRDLLAGGPRR